MGIRNFFGNIGKGIQSHTPRVGWLQRGLEVLLAALVFIQLFKSFAAWLQRRKNAVKQ